MSRRFDCYNWDANLYRTVEEIDAALERFHVKGKKLKQIRAIGMAANLGQQEIRSGVRSILASVGVPYEAIDAGKYPWLDQTLFPCEVKLCEPVIFVFEDDSALEIEPDNKQGLRIALGQIEPCLSDGLNRSNFDADIFFGKVKGAAFKEITTYRTTTEQHSATSSYSPKSESIKWEMVFTGKYSLYFQQKWSGTFLFGMASNWHYTDAGWSTATIDYSTVKKATKHVWQIPMTEGPGLFSIVPINDRRLSGEFPDGIEIDYSRGISSDEDYINDFLYYFLDKYFDPEYPYEEIRKRSGRCEFDCYSDNVYSYPTMRLMLNEIEHCAQLLASNYDDPSLSALKEHFTLYSFAPDHPDRWSLSSDEEDAIIKENVHIALDFYERFVSRMRRMMDKFDDCTAIDFIGP